MEPYYERLNTEKKELDEKIGKLKAFLETDKFSTIDPAQQTLMKIQAHAMLTYSQILFERIERLNATSPVATGS